MRIRYEIALFLVVVAILYVASKVFWAVFMNIGMEKNLCPSCGSSYIKKSTPQWLHDFPYRLFGLHAFRCTVCEIRFHAFREPSELQAQARTRQMVRSR